MMKKILLATLLLFSFAISAQNVRINATGRNIGGKHIRLFVADDYVSGLEVQKDDIVLSENDTCFNFGVLTDGVSIITLKIDAFEYSFISEPGKIYELKIDSINYAISDSINVLLHKYILPIEITNLDKDDLNIKISKFDAAIDEFVSKNDRELLVIRDSVTIDTLYKLAKSFLENENPDSYFSTYINYELGKMKHVLRLDSRKKLRRELFKDQPIRYYNIGYTDCFNHIFGHYFSQGNKYISQDELEFWLNTTNYDDLMDALGKDDVLKNEVFREFVLIKGMKDAFIDGLYDKQDLIKMLSKIASRTKFAQHKKTALSTIEYLNSISHKGLQVKDFEVKDIMGEKQNLGQATQKPLILNFVKLNDKESKRELEVINHMYESIKDNCEILTICCDRSLDAMYNFLKNTKIGNRYKWNFTFFDSNYDLLEYYQVKAFPLFILVSPDGKVEENPMKNPSEGSLSRFANKESK
ncbi:MAG: thioredoxin family protein [Bacteroidales bacterium]|nr:thioredoxin family protein [Bacteroidales bacterium]